MIPSVAAWIVLGTLAPARGAGEPASFRIGVVRSAAFADEEGFVRGAELALAIRNLRGGIFGHPLELVLLDATDLAREGLSQKGLCGVLAFASGEECARLRSSGLDLAVLGPMRDAGREAQVLADGLVETLRFVRVAFLGDGSKAARELEAELARRLVAPAALVLGARSDHRPRELEKRLKEASADVLVLDAPPAEVAAIVRGPLQDARLPLVLASRAFGAHAGLARELLFVGGLSPLTAPPRGEFLGEHREMFGEPGCGAAEGYELLELLATAIERAGTDRPEAVRAALATTHIDGPRGPVQADGEGNVPAVPALWRFTERARPHYPPAIAAGETIPDGAGRRPEARLGPAFGERRTDRFRFEPGTQAVRVHFGALGESTIESDLAQLGLTTGGASPFLDHLVREELLARTLAIVSEKYLRGGDGRADPGASLRVSFATHATKEMRAHELWQAVLAGSDPHANGRAFPGEGRCRVFSTNWLSTVLAHALTPPLGARDLCFLDGTYVFGSDYQKDRRSELIRALIQGYASSLGLTTAHEVGHLFGLEHETGDPTSLMSVDEEHGLAPEDAHFSAAALECLRKNPGVVQGSAGREE